MFADDVRTFDRFARAYDLVMPGAAGSALTAGLDRAERPVERVVDLAGGTGRAAVALSVPERVVIDAARGMLRRARDRGLSCVQGDATRLPLADASTDGVVIVDALHHLPDHGAVLAEIHRVLRPGGVVVVSDFDPATVPGRALVVAEHLVGFDSTFHTSAALCERLGAAGFEPTVVKAGFGYTVAGVKGETQ